MNASPPSPDRASRARSIALWLSLAGAALTATVIVVVLRAPSSGRMEMAQRGPSPLLVAANRAEIATEPGMYRVDGQMTLSVRTTVRRAAEQGAEVKTELPEGTVVDLVARRSGWTLVAWPNGTGGVLIGWVVLPASAGKRF